MTLLHPGAVGVSFGDANRLLDALEGLGTEPHALLVRRHGETALEGYWAPYGPGMIHGCQSLTKTVTGVALGAALQEGLLRLDERLIDIFPEYAHHTVGKPWWDRLMVKHITTMSAGMERQPAVMKPGWLEGFFEMEIVNEPGTAFYYNSIACSMVGACIRKRTGQGLMDFMSERVFRTLGIAPPHLRWHKQAAGKENGSGGFISTVRDNALLMELYRLNGVWNGERILSEEWVRFALAVQNDHTDGEAKYGGMLWIRPACYVADGAMGQWGMYFPKEDAIVAINQTIGAPDVDNQVRDAVVAFVRSMKDEPVAWTEEEERRLAARLASLSIPAPQWGENRPALAWLNGKTLEITEGEAHFFADDLNIFNIAYTAPVRRFAFEEVNGDLLLTAEADAGSARCTVALRGYRPVCDAAPINLNPARTVSATGRFVDDHTLRLEIRWLESCRVHVLTIAWDQAGASLTTHRVPVGGFDVPDVTARGKWLKEG